VHGWDSGFVVGEPSENKPPALAAP
jgi:hypothetical protein